MTRNIVVKVLCVALLGLLAACGSKRGDRTLIQNKGSDTLVNVAQAWAEAYAKKKPGVAVAVTGGGSGTGIAALINGTVDIANASRKMKQKEIDLAKSKGIEPKEWVVGYDALAVYIHKDNPKNQYTLKELADIYGDGGPTTSWNDLGVKIPGCGSAEIVRFSRQNNSGTYAYFRKTVLGKGDFKLGSMDLHGSKDVVDAVEKTPCAIGYSGLAYATEHVQLADVARDANGPYVTPTVNSAVDGSYPIARPLLMYTNGEPTGATKEYLDWILSAEGQAIIKRKGYAPVK
ncbi:MAG: PstS family phosphate ABC transporter substrate-binding protein [Planctomycetota bacterium]|nr:PstS family phosphate ABC transporter substrate-binding protein [Planctomycetota bacterium]